ncbi:MAG: ribbon-helix-helix domain-containing protein [bacterium]|nr:ribbon-helix-helix domain-containing protein [bacterium]
MSSGDNKDKVTIKIPRKLYEEVKNLIADTGFSSATEFIVYVLRDIVAGGKLQKEEALNAEEMELIRKRLRALGYIKE